LYITFTFTEEIYNPGEIEALNEDRHKRFGIPIPEKTVTELNSDANKLGIASLTRQEFSAV